MTSEEEAVAYEYLVRVEDAKKRELLQELVLAPGPAEAARIMARHSTNLFGKLWSILNLGPEHPENGVPYTYAIFPENADKTDSRVDSDVFLRVFVQKREAVK